jgi:hypothetical protein
VACDVEADDQQLVREPDCPATTEIVRHQGFLVLASDIPEGVTIADYRTRRRVPKKSRRAPPRLRLRGLVLRPTHSARIGEPTIAGTTGPAQFDGGGS